MLAINPGFFGVKQLKPPSFFVEKENQHGLMLHYRSKRRYGGEDHQGVIMHRHFIQALING